MRKRPRAAVLVHRFSCLSSGDITCLFTVTYGSLRHVRSQLVSEDDLHENHGCPNLFLPDYWGRHVKSALLHVISLARLACVHTWAWAATRPCRGPWSRPRKARSFRRLISAAYTTSTRGRRDRIRVLSNPFREGSLRRVGKNGPFVPVGEPIAAVNWCKGDAAQQRNLKNPRVSTPMEFLVGTTPQNATCQTKMKLFSNASVMGGIPAPPAPGGTATLLRGRVLRWAACTATQQREAVR